ncbi:UNVERIFIED_CONTAM: hypothetical protein PYX00_001848 [Menopon gallinae]|uniref:SAM domain-containing protein n=1 Tax=Menopon gallinae TaxID=328185 RepID=A0AAW2IEE3_9NEOP
MTSSIPYLPISEYERSVRDGLIDEHFEAQDDVRVVPKSDLSEDTNAGDSYSGYVELLLQGMQMEKYVPLFQSIDIGIQTLLKFNNEDLIEIGITDKEDREVFLRCIRDFGDPNSSEKESYPELESNQDDLIMACNVFHHLVEINSHIDLIHFKMSKNGLEDYFVSTHKTALEVMNFVTNHALTQSDRISNILYDGKLDGNNLISSLLKVQNLVILDSLKVKLIMATGRKKKVRNRCMPLIFATAVGVAIGFLCYKRMK